MSGDDWRTPALRALLAAEAAHAALCALPGCDDGVLRRAYIAALEAQLAYVVECRERGYLAAVRALQADIATERRALAALEDRR